ncbi:MAG: NupC/NupG family nucleoside CNT transporter [Alphaproteobacteria bacterium]
MNETVLIFQGMLGVCVFIGLGWLLSENRRLVNFKAAFLGFGAQFALAAVIIKVKLIRDFFLWISCGVNALKESMLEGTSFVFGYLGGGEVPFAVKTGSHTFIFMFQALPMIMVISALAMLLFHWRVLPIIVEGFSWVFQKILGVGGALGVCAAAKIFFGQTEAPLLVKPYLRQFTRSELFTVMTAGMATTSVSLMVLYSTILEKTIVDPVAHILTASIISIPAAVVVSRIMVPHTGDTTSGHIVAPYNFSNSMDAISQGTADGMRLMLNIAAMLVVTLALVALVNKILGTLPLLRGHPVTLQLIMGYFLSPVAWLMGIPASETVFAGSLLGTKAILNEVAAFISLSSPNHQVIHPTTNLIMMYALCGFANLASIAIQIGGIGGMVPERRNEIIALGFKALIAGTLASCMSGTVIGLLYHMHW